MFLRRSDSKDEKFPVKIGEIHKIPKKNFVSLLEFLVMNIRKIFQAVF